MTGHHAFLKEWFVSSMRICHKKNQFVICWISTGDSFCVRNGGMYPLSLLMLVSHLVQAHPGPPCVCCQSLWIQICFGSPVFRRPVPFFPWCFHSLWLSRSFHLHFYKVILALQGEIWWRPTIEYSKVFHPLHIASALGLIYCNKKHLWWWTGLQSIAEYLP